MIKTNKGKIVAKGRTNELLADIAVIIRTVYNEALLVQFPEEQAKEILNDIMHHAILTDEQLAQQVATDLMEALKKVFMVEESEDEEA